MESYVSATVNSIRIHLLDGTVLRGKVARVVVIVPLVRNRTFRVKVSSVVATNVPYQVHV